MRIRVLVVCLVGVAACDAAAAHRERLAAARAACYELPEPVVFAAVQRVIESRFSVTHASEPRGTIETDPAGGIAIRAEIIQDYTAACAHEFGCYRVRLRASGDGARAVSAVEQELQLAIHRRLTRAR